MSLDTNGKSPSTKGRISRYQRLSENDHDSSDKIHYQHRSQLYPSTPTSASDTADAGLDSLALLSSDEHDDRDDDVATQQQHENFMIILDNDGNNDSKYTSSSMNSNNQKENKSNNKNKGSNNRGNTTKNNIFRKPAWNDKEVGIAPNNGLNISNALHSPVSTYHDSPSSSKNHSFASSRGSFHDSEDNDDDHEDSNDTKLANKASSLQESNDDNEDNIIINSNSSWEDWLDDDPAIRRYHVNFRPRVPLPAEFHHQTLLQRMWKSFQELRFAARQRRAARLLNMPSESFPYRLQACLMTWLCDATDYGILLVAGVMLLWWIIGWIGSLSVKWWYAGISLFIVRVSARRLYERFMTPRVRGFYRKKTVSETMELGTRPIPVSTVGDDWRRSSDSSNMIVPEV